MKQEFEKYTKEDLEVWNTLFKRQTRNIVDKASLEYQEALVKISPVINAHELPNFKKINEWFKETTSWEVVCVPGLIEVDDFFTLLANKKFPSSAWLRSKEKLNYLEEPDMFHDIYGHIPLLSNPKYSNFVHQFGKIGLEYIHDEVKLLELQRLYWFTIEFGLIQEDKLRIYGAGILSSFGETKRSLIKESVTHKAFDLTEILQKEFITSEMQDTYFCLNNFEQLENTIKQIKDLWYENKMERVC